MAWGFGPMIIFILNLLNYYIKVISHFWRKSLILSFSNYIKLISCWALNDLILNSFVVFSFIQHAMIHPFPPSTCFQNYERNVMLGIQRLFVKIMLIYICYKNRLFIYWNTYGELNWKFTARHKKEIDFLPFLNKSLSCEVREIWHSNVRHSAAQGILLSRRGNRNQVGGNSNRLDPNYMYSIIEATGG